ncbi:unnamed protein product [Lactuca virosa]|uniref:Uncharacterized protein n=1 Tax=Lactuca virosa TaxID=75947 RepID=A0AAU9NA94_9ASTR|nr:unnamed protein product [Lactuca virosa]
MDANINSGEQTITSLPEKTIITPPWVSHSKSNMEEEKTSNINVNLSNKDVNVHMGDGSSTTTVDTTAVPPPPLHLSPPKTSTILPISILVVSPTFQAVMNEPITSLFSSQSIEVENTVNIEEEDEYDFMVGFGDLEFNPHENDVPNNAGDLKKTDIPDKTTYVLGYGHLKTFLDAYFAHLATIDIDLSTDFNISLRVPKPLLKGKISIKDFEYGEIMHDPLGYVFIRKGKKESRKKFLFRVDDVESYSNTHLTSILLHINNCQRNKNEDRAKIRKIIHWYMKIREVCYIQ